VLLPIVNRRDQCGERNERVLKWKLRKTGFESKEGGEIEIKPLEMFRWKQCCFVFYVKLFKVVGTLEVSNALLRNAAGPQTCFFFSYSHRLTLSHTKM
jgi:hypothetical protein